MVQAPAQGTQLNPHVWPNCVSELLFLNYRCFVVFVIFFWRLRLSKTKISLPAGGYLQLPPKP